jgi:hypothetical protein
MREKRESVEIGERSRVVILETRKESFKITPSPPAKTTTNQNPYSPRLCSKFNLGSQNDYKKKQKTNKSAHHKSPTNPHHRKKKRT